MLKNTTCIIKYVVVCVVAMCFCCVCYAGVTEVEISINCNESSDIVHGYVYAGIPDTQLSLITKGMQVLEIKKLIVDWDEFKSQQSDYNLSDPVISAECLPYANGKRLFDGYGFAYESMWPPGQTLVCKKGEGMSVAMYAPNDVDTNKYKYVATLIMNKDEKKKDISAVEKLCIGNLKNLQTDWLEQKANQLFGEGVFSGGF
jgi:hypothetical protein